MLKVFIYDERGKRIILEVQKDITVRELNEKYCKAINSFQKYEFIFEAEYIDYNSRLSDYDIGYGEAIIAKTTCKGGGGFHICPYGCGRQIPDEYKGCTELLKDKPNYFG